MVPRWLLDRKDLTPAAKLIYGVVRAHEMGGSGACVATSDKLAHETGLSVRTVDRALSSLEQANIIARKSEPKSKFITTKEWECGFYPTL